MSAPRFLLINPWIYDFTAFDLWSRPLGFLSLCSYLRRKGCVVDYVNALHLDRDTAQQWGLEMPERRSNGTGAYYSERIPKPDAYAHIPRYYRRFGLPPRVLRDRLQQLPQPDAILVTSGMTYWYPGLSATMELLHDVFPHAPSYLGGPYATLCTSHARENVDVDRVIAGPWETELMPVLEREHDVEWIPEETSFESLPFPAMGLYPESSVAVTRLTRGCPYSCDYCASDRLSGAFTGRSPDRFADEIAWNVAHGRREIALFDEAALVRAEQYMIPALRRVAERDIPCRFHTPNGLHSKFMTPTIAELFRRNNFETVRLSFEAVRGTAREASDGKATPADFENAMHALRDAGYETGEVEVYMLIGLPGQSDESIRETAEFIRDQGAIIRTAQYSPVPGTPLMGGEEELPEGIREEPLLHNSTIAASWEYDVQRYDRLKNYTRELNRQLRAH